MKCPVITNDMNGDGFVTISDVWPMLSAAYHWPGNWLVEAMAQKPGLMRFLEIGPTSCGGWFSFALSTVAWFAVLLAIGLVAALIETLGNR